MQCPQSASFLYYDFLFEVIVPHGESLGDLEVLLGHLHISVSSIFQYVTLYAVCSPSGLAFSSGDGYDICKFPKCDEN